MNNKKYKIGIITINNNININTFLEHFSYHLNIDHIIYSSEMGTIFNNQLKFKTFLKHKEELSLYDYLIHINEEIEKNDLEFLLSNIKDDMIKTINYSGDAFACCTKIFLNLSTIINNNIYNDLSYDINVTKWNYQINKYLKTLSNVINYNSQNVCKLKCTYFKFKEYVTVNLIGGLGNLLFQIIATYYYAKLNNYTPIFCVTKNNNKRPSICKYRLFDKLTKYSLQNELIFTNKNELNFFDVNEKNQNIKLYGLFHDKKYISDILQNVTDILNFKDFSHINIDQYKLSNTSNLVSVHVRRTDYLKCNMYRILNKEYYQEAMSKFDINNTLFLIFSDDIKWCKQSDYFSNIHNKLFVETNMSDEEELYLMSKCDHNIIANSTFSLWGHYLNQNPNKKIVLPKEWFTSNINFDATNLIVFDCSNVIFIYSQI